ncbi:prepilin-type N-terminal cleavage/methylation domain-containing protein [Candidatus Sumerlaeota bacterium]|nr:prepilin-type N-terminal cleavage/methylation domain-containing protein [Candidatus Sumerlaeota bacterium]
MKKRGFTLIELLIVVAIIAILAAIAVPNFLEAQTRAKVSRVRSDHRSLATAVESYYVDNNEYPAMTGADQTLASADYSAYRTAPGTGVGRTFRARNNTFLLTLTTPIAYITSVFPDPFADTKGIGFRYYTDGPGWILGSWGPDVDEAVGGDLAWNVGTLATTPTKDGVVETVYDNTVSSQPSSLLITGSTTGTPGRGGFTYDPTNGTISDGDLWRVRQ